MATGKTNPEQRQILQLYAAYGAGLVLCVVPFFLAALLSMCLFAGVLVAAYILRAGAAEGSLMENHMIFVIRTIWIGGFLALLTMTAGSVYLFHYVDNTPLDPCIAEFLNIGPGTQVIEIHALKDIFWSCFENYITRNFKTFAISAAIAAGPALLYFIIRYARGLSRALNGYRVAKPNGWF